MGDSRRDELLEALANTAASDPGDPTRSGVRPASARGFQPGDVLGGRYHVLSFVARGGMGEVYEVLDVELNETVALKTLRPDEDVSSPARERFLREIRLARKVTHPNVCRIFDLGQHVFEDGRKVPFLTMELLRGQTMHDRLAELGPLPTSVAVGLLRDTAIGLSAAHAAGVVHRDLKASNIFLVPTADGGTRAVVTDFGIALAPGLDETATGGLAFVGTPAYMAPEQVTGAAVGPATDVFALGVVAYELVTGELPFVAASVHGTALRRLGGPPVPPSSHRPEVPPAWDAAILKALALEPADRFARPEDFVQALSASAVVRAPTPRQRGRRLATLGALAFAVVVAAFVGSTWLRPAGPPSTVRLERETGLDPLSAALPDLVVARLAVLAPRLAVTAAPGAAVMGLRLSGAAPQFEVAVVVGSVEVVGTGPSVRDAADAALGQLVSGFGKDWTAAVPTFAERALMLQFGTDDVIAWRALQRGVEAMYSTSWPDWEEAGPAIALALERQPRWAYARIFAAGLLGFRVKAGRDALLSVSAQKLCTAPADVALLKGMLAIADSQYGTARTELSAAAAARPSDVVSGFYLSEAYSYGNLDDDALSVLRRLHEALPLLQFGADVAGYLVSEGKGADARQVIERWIASRPGAEQAHISALALAVRLGSPDTLAQADRLIALFGDSPHRQLIVTDVALATGSHARARALAEPLLQFPMQEPEARYRLAYLEALEGHFGAALQAAERAVISQRARKRNLKPALELLRTVAAVAGSSADVISATRELVELHQHFGEVPQGRAASLELDWLTTGGCPTSPGNYFVENDDPEVVRETRRLVLRVSASHGCARCEEVVAAGLGKVEDSTASLLSFAACARKQGDDYAERMALDRAGTIELSGLSPYIGLNSPVGVVQARFQSAELAERTGDLLAARAGYRWVLDRWSDADRPLPEAAAAKKALLRLQTK